MPKVSFVIPVYNVERYLSTCLRSIQNQTFTDWEAVCVNDASTDGSLDILKKFASEDSRFKIIDARHGGVSATRNKGLEAVTGEFVIYTDSDDFIHPQLLEIALDIQARSGADIVTWYKDRKYRMQQRIAKFFKMDYDSVSPVSFKRKYNPSRIKYHLTDDLIAIATENGNNNIRNAVPHNYSWRAMMRKELAAKVKFVEGITFEDFPWWSEILLQNPLAATTNLPIYCYRLNAHSIDNGSALSKKLYNWVHGMDHIWTIFRTEASPHQMECWSRNIKWPIIYYQMARHLKDINTGYPGYGEIVGILQRLDKDGIFEDAKTAKDRWSAARIRELYDI